MTIKEKIRQHLRITGYVLENSFSNEKTFRDAVSIVRKEGFDLKRVYENNKIIGYRLAGQDNE